mmetsp:Transcript_1/g.4  ORF Transcript_1/g.4 Transcript_1/m.4 type:complete len:251 (-) Transcript_1:140-892(-)
MLPVLRFSCIDGCSCTGISAASAPTFKKASNARTMSSYCWVISRSPILRPRIPREAVPSSFSRVAMSALYDLTKALALGPSSPPMTRVCALLRMLSKGGSRIRALTPMKLLAWTSGRSFVGSWFWALVRVRRAVELATLLVTSACADWTNPNRPVVVDSVALLLRSAVEATVPPIKVVSVLRTASRLLVVTVLLLMDADDWTSSVEADKTTAVVFVGMPNFPGHWLGRPTPEDQPRENSRRLVPTRITSK